MAKRKATHSLTAPEAKQVHRVHQHVPASLQDSLGQKLNLIKAKLEARKNELVVEDSENAVVSLVVTLSLAPLVLAAFPHEASEGIRRIDQNLESKRGVQVLSTILQFNQSGNDLWHLKNKICQKFQVFFLPPRIYNEDKTSLDPA